MSSQNNESSEAMGYMGAAGMVFLFIGYALAAFMAIILTIVSVIAWNQSVTFFKMEFWPERARAFIFRGLTGMIAAPLFVTFTWWLFEFPHDVLTEKFWFHVIFGGYVIGSAVIEACIEHPERPVIVHSNQRPSLPAPRPAPTPQRQPFTYASWTD